MSTRKMPTRLGDKLKTIRLHLDYTLEEMAEAVGKEGRSRRSRVFEWENGVRVPDYGCLLAYAKLAETSTDDLIDDTANLLLGKNRTEKGQRDL